jgi:hypothetical protein
MGDFMNKQVQIARQTNLVSFLLFKGVSLVKQGSRFILKDHDSCVISGNMFFWNSVNEKGNTLDFVILYFNLSFKEALNELLLFNDLGEKVSKESVIVPNICICEISDRKRAIAYLCKTRKINYQVIKKYICKYISQDDKGNIIFKIYDNNNRLNGYEIVGMTNKRFKKVAWLSEEHFGFNIKIGSGDKSLFFESVIDLFSFLCLFKEKIVNHRLISLGGLREEVFFNMVNTFCLGSEIFLCFDNDFAGVRFSKYIKEKEDKVHIYLPKNLKDWNEILKNKV